MSSTQYMTRVRTAKGSLRQHCQGASFFLIELLFNKNVSACLYTIRLEQHRNLFIQDNTMYACTCCFCSGLVSIPAFVLKIPLSNNLRETFACATNQTTFPSTTWNDSIFNWMHHYSFQSVLRTSPFFKTQDQRMNHQGGAAVTFQKLGTFHLRVISPEP